MPDAEFCDIVDPGGWQPGHRIAVPYVSETEPVKIGYDTPEAEESYY